MAWVLVTGQTASLNNATTITPTVAVPNTIGSGNIYLGAVGYDSAQTLNSVTDDKGNTYNLKSTITETTDLIKITQFELGNITNGPKTITFHFSAATDSCAVVAEFSGGLAAADPNDGTTGQFQAAVASGANNVTSTAIVTTVDGDLIVGASLDGASTTAPTTGTSPSAFISIGTASDATTIFAIRLEYFVQTTHGSIAATFGIGVNGDSAATNVVALKPSAGAATVNAIDPVEWRRLPLKFHPVYQSQFLAYCPTVQPIGVQFCSQSTSDTTGAAATSFTDSTKLTIPALPDRALVVTIAWSSTAPTGVSITWGGTALSLISNTSGANGTAGNTAIYGLLNPATGTQTLAGSWTGARDFYVAGQVFTNVDQTSLTTAFQGNFAIGTSASASVSVNTAVAGQMVVAGFSVAGAITSVTVGTRHFVDSTQTAQAAAARLAGSSGAQAITLANANVAWVASRVIISASTGTMDTWFAPWTDPPKRNTLPTSEQQSLVLPAPASQDIPKYEWTVLWQDPVRSKLGLPPNQQPFLAFTPPQIAAVSGTGNLFWHSPWSIVMLQTILIGEG